MSQDIDITHVGMTEEVIRQRKWTETELLAAGYEFYDRKKEVTMVRRLPRSEAPLIIPTRHGDELVAEAGYMICYVAGDELHPALKDYEQWPVSPEVFQQTYREWDEPDWRPTAAQGLLMQLGCRPYYKYVGIWAKKLDTDTYLQSMEHAEPIRIQPGQYVAIGTQGEPYSMGAETLHRRYVSRRDRFIRWFSQLIKS